MSKITTDDDITIVKHKKKGEIIINGINIKITKQNQNLPINKNRQRNHTPNNRHNAVETGTSMNHSSYGYEWAI